MRISGICAEFGYAVQVVVDGEKRDATGEELAHIVACVNACDGVSDADLTPVAFLVAIGSYSNTEQSRRSLYESLIQAQRDMAAISMDVSEWECESCNKSYRGPPRPNWGCVQCSCCGGRTLPKNATMLNKANARIIELEEMRDKLLNILNNGKNFR